MWQKKHRSEDPEAPPGKRLRDNLVDLCASGDIPGDRAQPLLQDAGDFVRSLGSDEFADLRRSQAAGALRNQERDLRRRLLKRSKWPPVYVEEVRCYSVKDQELVMKKVAFLLPHELIACLGEVGDPEIMQQSEAELWSLSFPGLQRNPTETSECVSQLCLMSGWLAKLRMM